jgi:hypothetical protein
MTQTDRSERSLSDNGRDPDLETRRLLLWYLSRKHRSVFGKFGKVGVGRDMPNQRERTRDIKHMTDIV